MQKEKVHRVSVKAMVVHEDRLLLIKKIDSDGEYFIFPGGGQEHGEALTQTLIREVKEETGFAVEPGELVCIRDYIGANHEFRDNSSHFHQVELYFSAKLLKDGHTSADLPDAGQIGVEWLPLAKVLASRVYPLSLRSIFANQRSEKIYVGDVN